MTQETGLQARINITGTLVFRDDAGNVVGTTEFKGSKTLGEIGMTEEQAREFIAKEQGHGLDDR